MLGLVAAVGVGAAVWLLIGRVRLTAAVASAETRAVGAEGERDRAGEALRVAAARVEDLVERNHGLETRVARLEQEMESAAALHGAELRRAGEVMGEQLRAVEQRERTFREEVQGRDQRRDTEMREAFKALSAESLSRSSTEFLKLAEQKMTAQQQAGLKELEGKRAEVNQMLQPISETLRKTEEQLKNIGTQWQGDRSSLVEQIKGMAAQNEGLRNETLKLSRALSKPEVRGRYGEIQLRRVAELSGMAAYCDFAEQASQRDDAGRLLRPDMIVKLPNARVIAVDAKCNTYAYLQAAEADSDVGREECLERFARHIVDQVGALSKKGYWQQLEGSPEFVVMFVPGDQFLDAALARRGDLLEHAAECNVILASPSTLIGLLRAVAVGWKERRVEEQARELMELGRALHERAATAFEKVAGMGDALGKAVKKYNEFVGSYESRFEPTLRKFEDAGVKSGKELPVLAAVETLVRTVVPGEGPGLAE